MPLRLQNLEVELKLEKVSRRYRQFLVFLFLQLAILIPALALLFSLHEPFLESYREVIIIFQVWDLTGGPLMNHFS